MLDNIVLKVLVAFCLIPRCSSLSLANLESLLSSVNPEALIVLFDGDDCSLSDNVTGSTTSVSQVWTLFLPVNETHLLRHQENSLVILNLEQPEKIHGVFHSTSIRSLESNVWIVLGYGNANKEDTFAFAISKAKRLSLQSQIYYMEHDGNIVEVLGNANNNPTFKVCGYLSESCNFTKKILERRQRLNFNGQSIRVSYENFPNFCIVNDDGTLSGSIPEAFKVMAAILNLTIAYEKFPEPDWGSVLPNGSWTGGIGV